MSELIHQTADEAVRSLKIRKLNDKKADEYASHIFYCVNDCSGARRNKRLVNFINESVKAGN